MKKDKNLLFVCSRNQWRSPTGEQVWRKVSGFSARSAGTSPNAKKTVGPTDLRWADVIFVMEKKHKNRLVAQYAGLLKYKAVHILDIPDEYQYMDAELVSEIESKVLSYLELNGLI